MALDSKKIVGDFLPTIQLQKYIFVKQMFTDIKVSTQ